MPKPSDSKALYSSEALIRGALHIYGVLALLITGTRAFVEGSIIRRLPASFYDRIQTERRKFWDLSSEPEGFKHGFFQTKSVNLHYVTDTKTSSHSKSPYVVIFLHGWPDSWMLWRNVWRQCEAKCSQQTIYIALDLPGFGGSASPNKCSPDGVLEPIAEFILAMRERHWSKDGEGEGEVIVVCHDWGALCGFRLAAEAGDLADRFILSNAGLPTMVFGNVRGRIAAAHRMFRGWVAQPLKLGLLFNAMSTIWPVLLQLLNSFYIAIFNLPYPLPHWFLTVGNYGFLKLASWIAIDKKCPLGDLIVANHLASCFGPPCGEAEIVKAKSKGQSALTYPESVLQRNHLGSAGSGVSYYRHGLTLLPWSKSVDLMLALHEIEQSSVPGRKQSSSGLFDEGPPGALKAKATVIFGAKDPALDKRIMLDGMKDYMVKGSQVVLLDNIGHWVPVDGEGKDAFSETIVWALEGADPSLLAERVRSVCKESSVTISK